MKTLILIRHAKSSWNDSSLSDFERPLNERGKKDAPEMASRLKEKGFVPDIFVSSPAKRAKKTAKIFGEEFGVKKDDIRFVEELYLASPVIFTRTITGLEDKFGTVILFAHNPGITEYANSLTNVRIDNIPTCGVFVVQADTDEWKDFETASRNFIFFDYPKATSF
jgi:phosphohistidine phosphatase